MKNNRLTLTIISLFIIATSITRVDAVTIPSAGAETTEHAGMNQKIKNIVADYKNGVLQQADAIKALNKIAKNLTARGQAVANNTTLPADQKTKRQQRITNLQSAVQKALTKVQAQK